MSFERWIIDMMPDWMISEGWIVYVALIGGLLALRLLPVVLAFAGRVLAALLQLLFLALLEIVPIALSGLGHAILLILRGSRRLALLLWFVGLEAVQGAGAEQDDSPHDSSAASSATGASVIADACDLLGLPADGFSADDLKRAYRNAIKRAHPDHGGTAAEARAVMQARNHINEHLGWN